MVKERKEMFSLTMHSTHYFTVTSHHEHGHRVEIPGVTFGLNAEASEYASNLPS